MSNKILDEDQIRYLNYETFANPYCWFWGIRMPLIFVEQAVKTHPMVKDCFVHIHKDSDVNPELLLIIELEDYEKTKKEMRLLKDFTIIKGSIKILKEIKDVIKKNSSDFIGLNNVDYFLSINQFERGVSRASTFTLDTWILTI
mgnify:CR=1 FL=1